MKNLDLFVRGKFPVDFFKPQASQAIECTEEQQDSNLLTFQNFYYNQGQTKVD
jgi:hypothetical protein